MMTSRIPRICRIPILSACQNYLAANHLKPLKQSNKKLCTNNNNEANTIKEVVKLWSHKFEHEGISEPVESIEHILAHVLGNKKIMELADEPDRRLSSDQIAKLESLCDCRMSRMPVQYIIGEWDFRDITLKMIPPVFIPRPETEILVDIILKRLSTMKKEMFKVLDIGCGSGAISLALVHANSKVTAEKLCKDPLIQFLKDLSLTHVREKINCTSIDKSLYACDLTRQNAEILGLRDSLRIVNALLREDGTVKFVKSVESAQEFEGNQFDVIVSNPPYIPTAQIADLAPEIRVYEDLRALDGGRDGLNLVKALMKYASKALVPNGLLFMEVDPTHPEYVEFFTKKYPEYKLRHDHTYKDYCCNDRFVELSKLS